MRKKPKWAKGELAKNQIVTTVTSENKVFQQNAYDRDVWRKNTYENLLNNITPSEKKLFYALPRSMKKAAIQQHPMIIQGRILFIDIYVKKYNIAIEVDGGYHNTEHQRAKDVDRDKILASKCIRVYRISNEDVDDKIRRDIFIKMLTKVSRRGKFKGFSELEKEYVSNADDFIKAMGGRIKKENDKD